MKKEDYIKELLELDKDFPLKDDHNVADIRRFIALIKAEKQLEQLSKDVNDLSSDNDDLKAALEEKTAAVNKAEEEKTQLSEVIEEKNNEIAEKDEVIKAMTEVIESQEATKGSSKPTIKIGAKAYEVNHGITTGINSPFGKKKFTAKEISENDELAKHLVKQGSSALSLINK